MTRCVALLVHVISFVVDRPARPPASQPGQQVQKPGPTQQPVRGPPSPSQVEAIARDLEEQDDTMTNLKKTFAGIFGDM